MSTQVALILVGTTPGTHGVSLSPRPDHPSENSPGLVNVGGTALVNHWLAAVKHCSRLLPLAEKVFIISSAATHDAFVHWARSQGGFPPANIIQVADQECSMVDALAAAAQAMPSLRQGHVVLASLDYFMGPGLPLQQLVERMVIRGKDTLVYARPVPGAPMDALSQVVVDLNSTTITGEMVNPRVAAVYPEAQQSSADGMGTACLVPIALLHRNSLPQILGTSYPAGPRQLAHMAADLLATGKPVYGLHLDMALPMSHNQEVAYANAFLDFLHDHMQAERKTGPAALALQAATASSRAAGTMSRGDRGVEQLLDSVSQTKQVLLRFDVLADEILAAQEAAQNKTAPRTQFGPRELPNRFADVSTLRHVSKKQHPVYQTSSHEIGRRKPSQLDMPDTYSGSVGSFTKQFAPFTARSALITAVTNSNVHKKLDDF